MASRLAIFFSFHLLLADINKTNMAILSMEKQLHTRKNAFDVLICISDYTQQKWRCLHLSIDICYNKVLQVSYWVSGAHSGIWQYQPICPNYNWNM